ncbi:MAG: ABC transporter substrate-binding protein [Microbacterium sp.]
MTGTSGALPAELRMSRRSLLRAGAFLGGAGMLALSGCAMPTGLPGPGALNLAFNRSLASLDNKLFQFDAVVTAQRGVREALTRLTPDLEVENVLADRFEMTQPTRWTVRLREGIRYSDGSPVRIEDVSTALEMYRETPGGFLATLFPQWPTVVPVDERTFHLDSEAPMPDLDFLMANILLTPAADNAPEDLVTGVGTGPYVVASANPGTGRYRLERNEKYWGSPARISRVDVQYLSEESSRIVALRSGEVDVIDSISPDGIEQLRGLPGVTTTTRPGVRLTHLFYNFRKPKDAPLADPRVRQALSYAIDGPTLIDQILQDSVEQIDGVVPAGLGGAAGVGAYEYDPERAKSMLDALGATDLEVTIIWETGEFTADAQVMEAIYEMLRRVGCRPTLKQFEPGGDIATWRQGRGGDWDVIANGFPGTTGLAITMLQGMFAGTAEKEKNRDSYHGFVFPEITETIDRAATAADDAERTTLLTKAQQQVWDTWPAMWAFSPNAVVAHRERVRGVELNAGNFYDLNAVSLAGAS